MGLWSMCFPNAFLCELTLACVCAVCVSGCVCVCGWVGVCVCGVWGERPLKLKLLGEAAQ